VLRTRSTNSEAVPDAMEMAVLSSVRHPGVVQVYACLTDMVVADEAGGGGSGEAPKTALQSACSALHLGRVRCCPA
jgi:hypothetical protein